MPAPVAVLVTVPALLIAVVNVSAPTPQLVRVKLLVPVTPPENVVVPEVTNDELPIVNVPVLPVARTIAFAIVKLLAVLA